MTGFLAIDSVLIGKSESMKPFVKKKPFDVIITIAFTWILKNLCTILT